MPGRRATPNRTTRRLWAATLWSSGAVLLAAVLNAASPDPQASTPAPVAAPSPQASHSAAPSPPTAADHLTKYCSGCHNPKARVGSFSFSPQDLAGVPGAAETWEKVIRKLRTRTMPPAGRPRPDEATYDEMAGWLE